MHEQPRTNSSHLASRRLPNNIIIIIIIIACSSGGRTKKILCNVTLLNGSSRVRLRVRVSISTRALMCISHRHADRLWKQINNKKTQPPRAWNAQRLRKEKSRAFTYIRHYYNLMNTFMPGTFARIIAAIESGPDTTRRGPATTEIRRKEGAFYALARARAPRCALMCIMRGVWSGVECVVLSCCVVVRVVVVVPPSETRAPDNF